MAKKLLVDGSGTPIRLQLSENAGGQMIARGEFGRADIPTENKRIYPRSLWEREIKRIQDSIREGKVLGECDHPADGRTSLKRVSHVITGLEIQDDGQVVGEARILDNEHGRQLLSILKAGGAVGVSSRGLGSTNMNEDGFEVVQEDFAYMTHDFVADPAVRTSYPKFEMENRQDPKPQLKEKEGPTTMGSETKTQEKPRTETEKTPPTTVTTGAVSSEGTPTATVTTNETPKVTTESVVSKVLHQKLEEQRLELEASFQRQLKEAREAAAQAPELLAGRVVLGEVAQKLRPFLLPEDLQQVVQEKDQQIQKLKSALEARDVEMKSLQEKAERFGETARTALLSLHLEKALSKTEDREALRKLIGDPRRFTGHRALIEAIESATRTLASVKEDRVGIQKREQELQREYEKKLEAEKARSAKLESNLKEAADLAKQFGLRAYALEKTKGNPNQSKILKLAESAKSRAHVDILIEKYAVAGKPPQEYNSIRNRFRKFEKSTLVEDHLRETGDAPATPPKTSRVEEGVDREMMNLFPGTDVDQVRALGGM